MNFQNLKTELSNGILLLRIVRPEKLNALNQQTMDELSACFDWIYGNVEIKAVLLTGEGEKAFVAGADIGEFASMNTFELGHKLSKKGQDIFFKIEDCPKPVLAAVNGFALGGGCELAMACHMRVASENAQFAQPEINLGIIPGYGGTQRLTALVGKGKALELMLTADKVGAQTALQIGLVNHVVPQNELLEFSMGILAKIVVKPPLAVASTIAACNDAGKHNGYDSEVDQFAKCVVTEDFKEGISAFFEKRTPIFRGI
jgi:enoyl-CoA hydratase